MALKMKRVAEGIYKRGNVFYERITFDGRNTFKKLAAATLKEARDDRTARRALHLRAKDGLAPVSPYEAPAKPTQSATVADLCQEFLKAGCPDKNRQFKTGHGLDEEKRRVRYLQAWDGWGDAEKISNAVLLRYETYRKGMKGTKLKNGRSIDMEVTTLKNVLRWGVLCERIKAYPFANVEIIKFQKGESAHAKHHCAQSPEELHTLAARLFSFPQSEVLGFQYLFEAFTGLRTSEALACRWNAKYGEPGFIDGDYLHVGRKKDGVNPWVKIHPALRALLDAMKLWRDTRKVIINNKAEFPLSKSQWFFPSPQYPTQAVCRKSLAHALQREVSALIKEKKLPAGSRRTSHGARAFYVWARRSDFEPGKTMPPSDAEIAAEIGDATGAPIVASTYGPIPPNWMDSKAGKITWLPADSKPAWEALLARLPGNVVELKAA